MKIILATKSPYRQDVFRQLGIDFIAESSNIKEDFGGRPGYPEELTLTLARLKAEAVARRHKEGIVIGFDSVGFFDGQIMEKVMSRDEAYQRLKTLSGKSFQFFTGIHMINLHAKKTLKRVVKTDITMRKISDSEINSYLDQDPDYKRYAPGFDPRKYLGSSFTKSIDGSYNNFLFGMPVEAVAAMLSELGYKI